MNYTIKEVDETLVAHIPQIMKKVYGLSFPQTHIYDEHKIRHLIKQNLATFFIALDEHGEVLALLGMQYCSPYRTAAEFCPFVSDPKVRGMQSGYLIKNLVNAFYAKIADSLALQYPKVIYALATTDHPLVIEFCKFLDFTLTGTYRGWTAVGSCVPEIKHLQMASAHSLDKQTVISERRADYLYVRALPGFTQPYQVSLPTQYGALLRNLYEKLALPVTFIPMPIATQKTLIRFDRSVLQKRTTIEIDQLGTDATSMIAKYLMGEIKEGIEIIHIILPLNQGDTSQIVEKMLSHGCGFCGLLPFYRNRDVLILQYINCLLQPIPPMFVKMAAAIEIESYADSVASHHARLTTENNLND